MSTRSNSPEDPDLDARSAAINIARGRPASFIDEPLPDDASIRSLDTDHTPAERDAAIRHFMTLLQQRVEELPLNVAEWPEPNNSERRAVVCLVASQRVCEEEAATHGAFDMRSFWDQLQTHLAAYVVRGVPDRDGNVVDLARRVYSEARDEVGWLSVRQGNPFRSSSGMRLLRAALLAYAHAFVRRAVRLTAEGTRRAFWLRTQWLVVLATNGVDEEQAGWFFRFT
ncbi:uncharacterized protein IWZ02DRAFT_437338 [Phyllosticta citriasiana]|uniref:uncharacterized protein n=1 Tax=Phyllosticta citriasiana TaxID=595635 RepID=UPI0030FD343E